MTHRLLCGILVARGYTVKRAGAGYIVVGVGPGPHGAAGIWRLIRSGVRRLT